MCRARWALVLFPQRHCGVSLSEMPNRKAAEKHAQRKGAPDLLYHYTSIHGVEGILRDRAVRASMVQFLNDSGEFKYAMDMAKVELWKLTVNWPKRGAWKKLRYELESGFESHGHIATVYVFSLSEMRDQLSQWRAYCPAEGGYAIWFSTKRLKGQLRAQGFRLVRCEYNPEVQRRKLRVMLLSALDRLPDLQKLGRNRRKLWEIARELVRKVSILATSFKHPDFREESEWRAVRVDDDEELEKSFHIAGPVLVPHFLLRLDAVHGVFPIHHITAGPGPHQDSASYGLELFLEDEGINVTNSRTPLRSFK